jgi:hypothetical protein
MEVARPSRTAPRKEGGAMRLDDARRCVEEMIDAGVPLRDIEQYVRLADVPDQGKALLLYLAQEARTARPLSPL